MGDSLPRRAGRYAQERGSPNLRLPRTIAWLGVGGIGWERFRRSVESNVLLCEPPKIIVLHLGGNDLTVFPLTKIFNSITREIRYLRSAFSSAVIVWVDILNRFQWRNPRQLTSSQINKKRIRVNRHGRSWVRSTGAHDTLSIDIGLDTPGFFAADGVHLSAVGNAMYIDALRDVLLKHIE